MMATVNGREFCGHTGVVLVEKTVRVLAFALLTVALTEFPTQTHAQSEWLVTAGRGWGPYYLGMSEDFALRVSGPQFTRNTDPTAPLHFWKSVGAFLTFSRQDDKTYVLWTIDITDAGSVTREGIRVGSFLNDVVRTYGDSIDNIVHNGKMQTCLLVNLWADRPYPAAQANYERLGLNLEYLSRGIWFAFSSTAGSSTRIPSVTKITVIGPSVCHTP
jgi:hypothetical protein